MKKWGIAVTILLLGIGVGFGIYWVFFPIASITLTVPKLSSCPECVDKIKKDMKTLRGIYSCAVDIQNEKVTCRYKAGKGSITDMISVINKNGFDIKLPAQSKGNLQILDYNIQFK